MGHDGAAVGRQDKTRPEQNKDARATTPARCGRRARRGDPQKPSLIGIAACATWKRRAQDGREDGLSTAVGAGLGRMPHRLG
eukprot:6951394-Prymnesium_polylepis.2